MYNGNETRAQRVYSLEGEFDVFDLMEDLESTSGYVTPVNLAQSLQKEQKEDILNYVSQAGATVIGSCILSKRKDKIDLLKEVLHLGGRMTVKNFIRLLVSDSISEKDRGDFFKIVVEHIYVRAKSIKLLDNKFDNASVVDEEFFGIIAEMEDFVGSPYTMREFAKELRNSSFPEDFRSTIASLLKFAKDEYEGRSGDDEGTFAEAFIAKLKSFKNVEIADSAVESWKQKISALISNELSLQSSSLQASDQISNQTTGLRQRSQAGDAEEQGYISKHSKEEYKSAANYEKDYASRDEKDVPLDKEESPLLVQKNGNQQTEDAELTLWQKGWRFFTNSTSDNNIETPHRKSQR